MADHRQFDLDAALDRLAAAEHEAAPRPDARLHARVLADAAGVAAAIGGHGRAALPRTGRGLAEALRDWLLAPGGVAAALAFCLVLGMGLGYGAGLPALAIDAGPEGLAAGGGLEDFLLAAAAF